MAVNFYLSLMVLGKPYIIPARIGNDAALCICVAVSCLKLKVRAWGYTKGQETHNPPSTGERDAVAVHVSRL